MPSPPRTIRPLPVTKASPGCATRKARLAVCANSWKARKDQAGAPVSAIDDLDKKAAALEGRTAGLDFFGVSNREPGLAGLGNGFLSLMNLIDGADAMPTTQALKAVEDQQHALAELLARWEELKRKDLKALNDQLGKANLPAITM